MHGITFDKSAGWFYPPTIAKLGQKFDHAHIIVAQDSIHPSAAHAPSLYQSRRYVNVWQVGPYAKVRGSPIANSSAIYARDVKDRSLGPNAQWIWMVRSLQFLLDISTFKGNKVNWSRVDPS